MARRPEAPDLADITGALHDVSNALTVLLGWVSEARAEDASRDTVAYALDVVERRARMARDLARRAIGALPPDGGEDEVDGVVADVLASLKVEAEHARVKLTPVGGAPEARIRDGSDVSHALTNLVLNAVAHAPRDSRVWVQVAADDAEVTIDVVDQGQGVPAERAAGIFEGESTRAGGAGVGLRHARAVARAMGGDLALVPPSTQGARFRLTWPRSDARVPVPPPSIARVRPLEGKQVLVLEDDADVIDLLETALTARGAEVTIARTRAELMAVLAGPDAARHDAALLDLSPIEGDASGAIANVRARAPRAAIVLITGSAGGLPKEVAEGGVAWVRKPFEVHEVVTAIAGGEDDA